MNNLLIIYPHWVPANLAGVQRPRLIGNYLHEFDWKATLLTVESKYYEEELDHDLKLTVSSEIEVIYTKAYPLTRPRIIGDIGLRALPFLYKKALSLLKERKFDAIWIPIPSFYTALLGRRLLRKTGVPFGIDYIDPWVRDISNQNNLRARLSQSVARILEPIAIKKAAFITGVSTPYYWPAIERNFKKNIPLHIGMPYGFDPNDHKIELKNVDLPWKNEKSIKPWIYAGAFLPNSHLFIEALFASIAQLKAEGKWDKQIRLYFIGTGQYPAKHITQYALDNGIENIVFEDRKRHPFLHVLHFLSKAERVLLIGSTEKHYTASKTFQCILSEKPVFSILHKESSAVKVFEACEAEKYVLTYNPGDTIKVLLPKIKLVLNNFQKPLNWNPNMEGLNAYSSKISAQKLVEVLDELNTNVRF